MSYIEIFPKNLKAQDRLARQSDELFDLLVGSVHEAYGVPDYDIIAELNTCTAFKFNAKALELKAVPDVVVKISTSDLEFESKAEELKDLIVERWKDLFGEELTMECWLTFFHTWGCTIDFQE